MDREDIIRMAREAGIGPVYGYESIERFAALVAAAAKAEENEACAKVCEAYTDNDGVRFIDYEGHGYECAAAIRARRQA